jgi:GntR family transcriptional regulator
MPLDLSSLAVDRRLPVPLYFQIERQIEQQILGGRAKPGSRVPPEPDLAEHLGVSRSVVRQALTRLEQGGLLSRRPGRGSFVTEKQRRSWRLEGSEGFFQDEVERLGRSVVSRVLRCQVELLPSWAVEALQLEPAASGVVLERLRYVDGLVALYDLNYLPERFASAVLPLKDDPHGSLYRVLEEEYGLVVEHGVRIVDAVIAGGRFAELLEVERTAPLITLEAVDLDGDLEPFDCYRTWVRPDRVKLEVQVTPTRRRAPGSAGVGEGTSTGGRKQK